MTWRSGVEAPMDGHERGLEALAEEFLQRLQAGEAPDPEEFAGRHPEIADEVRRRLMAVGRLHQAARGSRASAGAGGADRIPERIGRFEVLRLLGRGAFGSVYLARDPDLDRPVAVKVPRAGILISKEEEERFEREARSAARLHHPGIVRVHEVGEEDGVHYIVSEYIEGQTLAERLMAGKMAFAQAAELGVQISEALSHAHREGVVHRDVKPGNILLDAAGAPHLSDFGLARRGGEDATMTLEGQILGTPAYMSPEQARGDHRAVDARSDVYSLGALLYELLTGERPFRGERSALILQVLHEEPRSPRSLDSGVPVDLETVCLKAMAKEPGRRYASVEELAEELRRWLRGEPVRARPVRGLERAWRWCRRKPLIAFLAAAVALLLVVVATVSTFSALRLSERNRQVQENLWRAYLSQAQAERSGGRAGRRFRGLEAVRRAAEIRPSPELRDEAIACLALPDIRVAERKEWSEPGRKYLCLAFDPEVERFAVDCHRPGTPVEIRRVDDNAVLSRLPGAGAAGGGFLFSRDGRRFLGGFWAAETFACTVWDLDRRAQLLSVPGLAGYGAADFSPDGKRVALVTGGMEVVLQDLGEGREVSRFPLGGPAETLQFHPDGRTLAVIGPGTGTVGIVDSGEGSFQRRLYLPAEILRIAWNEQGTLLAVAGADRRAYVYESTTWTLLSVLEGHQGSVVTVVFGREGDLLATASWDGTTRFWDPWSGAMLLSTPGEAHPPFSAGNRRLGFHQSFTHGGVWEVSPGIECRTLQRRHGYAIDYTSVAFSPDGRLLGYTSLNGFGFWDLERHREAAFAPQEMGIQSSGLFDPAAGFWLTSGAGGVGQKRRIHRRGDRLRLDPPIAIPEPGQAGHASLSRDGSRLAIVDSAGHRAFVYPSGLEGEKTVLGPHAYMYFVSLSPDGALAATSTWTGSGVKVWNARTGQLIRDLPVENNARSAFSPDGKWLLTAEPGEYRFWTTAGWEPVRRIPMECEGNPGHLAFSEDGTMLAITSDRSTIDLLDPRGERTLARLSAPSPRLVTALAFSKDGRRLAAANRSDVQLWELGQVREELRALGLDWRPPLVSPSPAAPPDGAPLAVEIDPGASPGAEGLRQEAEEAALLREIASLDRSIQERPLDAAFYRTRGRLKAKLELWKEAREDLEKALQISPEHTLSQQYLAWLLSAAPTRYRDAGRSWALAQQGLKTAPQRAVLLTNLGMACYRLGDWHGALAALQESRDAHEATLDITNFYFLSLTYAKLGLNPLAGFFYQEGNRLQNLTGLKDRKYESYRREAEELLGLEAPGK